jgi:SNW domain-containing protein 1
MGNEKRMQMLAREQNRDISEKVALGLAKPTQNKETMYDSRLFNQSSGFDSGFNEDQAYDKPLFAAQAAIQSIYRPTAGAGDDDDDGEGDAGAEMGRIQKASRFEVLGRAKEGFKGADVAEREEGPVMFEKDKDDPFGIEGMIGEERERADGGRGGAGDGGGEGSKKGTKRYGLETGEERDEEERQERRKRVRVEDRD